MGDILLNIPTESLVTRAAVGAVVALVATRLLLALGLKVPRVRTVAVLTPVIALVLVAAVSWRAPVWPTLWIPADAVGALLVPIGDGFRSFGPAGLQLTVAVWAALAAMRVVRTAVRTVAVARAARGAVRTVPPPPPEVSALVQRIARRLRVCAPPVRVVADCAGGATLVGIRRPVLLLDAAFVGLLDVEELEGLVAHELAHLKRRDNLIALLVRLARDVAFFVPGGRWASRRLHAEREVAADQLAVEVTGRPGALASGLLKVVDAGVATEGTAAFAPSGALGERVRLLVEDRPAAGRARRIVETAAVVVVVTAAVAAGVALPAAVAGSSPDRRDALAVLWTRGPAEVAPVGEPVAFAVYRRNPLTTSPATVRVASSVSPRELSPYVLRGVAPSVTTRGLGLRPRPRVEVTSELTGRYRATPIVPAQDGLALFWLSRLR